MKVSSKVGSFTESVMSTPFPLPPVPRNGH